MDIPEKLTVNGKEFAIKKLLGKGKGGYSYLAADEAGNEFVLKQLHHEPCDYYQFPMGRGSTSSSRFTTNPAIITSLETSWPPSAGTMPG